MKKAIKKPLFIVLIIIIFAYLTISLTVALAADFENGEGVLTVNVALEDNAMQNVQVGIYYVATVIERSNGKYIYNLAPEFVNAVDNWPEEMDKLKAEETRILASTLARFAVRNNIENVVGITDSNGVVTFRNLNIGVYLIVRGNAGNRLYEFVPALVYVGRKGVEVTVVKPKVEVEPTRNETPTPTVTPTITQTPTPTPTVEITDMPTPEGATPPVDITDEPPPQVPTPPSGDKPGDKIVQTGVYDFDKIITVLIIFGVLLLVVGLIQNKRSQKEN